jgi:hypothetical protein
MCSVQVVPFSDCGESQYFISGISSHIAMATLPMRISACMIRPPGPGICGPISAPKAFL